MKTIDHANRSAGRLDFLRTCVMGMGSYRGVIVEKVSTGYRIGSTVVKSADEVDRIIDGRLVKLENSIVK